jgi:hypothetical protein
MEHVSLRSFMICTSHQIMYKIKNKKNEMGRTYGERTGAYRILVGKPEEKRLFERPKLE